MKPIQKSILAAGSVAGFVSFAFAGIGYQNWTAPKAVSTKAAPALSCNHMLVPNSGPTASRVPLVSVNCTSEMKQTDSHCQSACGMASAAPTKSSGLTCDHMLVRNTGPSASRVPFISVKCTPDIAGTPECQSYCRSNNL